MLEAENMLHIFAVSGLAFPRRSDGGARGEACGKIEIRRKGGREGKGGKGKRKEVPSFSTS